MSEEENVEAVKRLFAAIERGDLASALEMLTEDVDWRSPVTRIGHADISWACPRHGRGQVAQFFRELGEKVRPEPFALLGFTAQGDRVIVEGSNKGRVNSTDRTYEHDWVMVFTLQKGKIARCWHYYDTADVAEAFRTM